MRITDFCDSYDEYCGCYNTFNGKCNGSKCQKYRLIEGIEKIKKICLDNANNRPTITMSIADRRYLEGKNRLAGQILIATSGVIEGKGK